jgi:hypothetical protein
MILLDFSELRATTPRPTFSKIAWTTTIEIELAIWKANIVLVGCYKPINKMMSC